MPYVSLTHKFVILFQIIFVLSCIFVLVKLSHNSMLLINNPSKRGDVETLARSVNLEDDMCLLVPFSNGRREGANLSSCVIVLLKLESLNHYCKPVHLS